MESIGESELSLEGHINVTDVRLNPINTINEPVSSTIKRDLKSIGDKLVNVLIPRKNRRLLYDWDLWGPLFICIVLSVVLHESNQGLNVGSGPEFAQVFILFVLGSLLATLNLKLLQSKISVFQSLCVLGYCALPLTFSAILCIPMLYSTSLFFLRLVCVVGGIVWSSYASMAFLSDFHYPDKAVLAVYPICLFYCVMGWVVICRS